MQELTKIRFRPWTHQEDTLLVELYSKYGSISLAKRMGRSENAIRHRAHRLKIECNKYFLWTEEKDELLREFYPNCSVSLVAARLGCNYRAIYDRIKKLGIIPCKHVVWTKEADEILHARYPSEGASLDLRKTLNCKVSAIYQRVHRLGLKSFIHRGKNPWTTNELVILRARFPLEGASKELRTALNRTQRSLLSKASGIGLKLTKDVLHNIACKAIKSGKDNRLFKGHEDISGNFITAVRRHAITRNLSCPLLDCSPTSNKYLYDLYVLQNKRCALTNEPIHFVTSKQSRNHERGSASLDRIDSSRGYVIGNVQWLHKRVNMMKRDLSQKEFILISNRVARMHPITNV